MSGVAGAGSASWNICAAGMNQNPGAPMTSAVSETPRTDALLLQINEGRVYETGGPMEQHARSLELALREATDALRAYQKGHSKVCECLACETVSRLDAAEWDALAKVEKT
jgi:hypothetical protein